MCYDEESFVTDIDWLEGCGIKTNDAKEFIISLLNKGQEMTDKEITKLNKMSIREIRDYEV